MKILYVEDNMANLFLVKRVAKIGNHEVINYIDGADALAHIERDQPDLVLMDIQLAGELSGLDVVKKMRSGGHKMPVIAVTAYAMLGDRERCLQSGCDDYIAKPLPIGQLTQIFEKYAKELQPVKQEAQPAPTATSVESEVPAPTTTPAKSEAAAPKPEPVEDKKETEEPPAKPEAEKKTETKAESETVDATAPTSSKPANSASEKKVDATEPTNGKSDDSGLEETVPTKAHLNGTARKIS